MYVLSLSQVGKESGPDVGGKGANLGEMVRAGLPVPPGFVVTTESYMQFLKSNRLEEEIKAALAGVDADNIDSLNQTSEKIRNMILSSKMPDAVERDIREAYEQLSLGRKISSISGVALDMLKAGRWDAIVAVRSSATSEDLSGASFAGQLESILSVHGKPQLLDAIKRCWASLFTPRVLFYRKTKGFEDFPSMGVIVQRMIQSDKSGVIFTANPVNNMENQIVIESAWGYGESIVSGLVTPDEHIIDKATGEVISKRIGSKKWLRRMDPVSGAVIKEAVDSDKVNAEVLNPSEVRKLWELARRVENYYGGKPQDIEWCIEKDRAFLVQTRPVTTLGARAETEKKEMKGEPLVKGLGASPGMARGKVRLAPDAEAVKNMEHGEILVTVMTNPSMVPLMRKAAAIVTDEGGSTCIEGEAKILTNKGFIKLKDVEEKLSEYSLFTLSINSETKQVEWRRVLRAYSRRKDAKRISLFLHPTGKFEDTIQITDDHEILYLNGDVLKKKTLNDLLSFDNKFLSITRIPVHGAEFSSDINNIDKNKLMYLAGAFLSEGHIDRRKSGKPMRLRFCQKENSEKQEFISTVKNYFIELFDANLVNYVKPQTIITHPNGYQTIRASSFECSRAFPAQIISKINENIVSISLSSKKEELIYFLAGFIDGDGHFNNQKKVIEIYIDKKTEKLKEAILISCLRLGIIPKIKRKKAVDCIVLSNNINHILEKCKRVRGVQARFEDYKLFSPKQVLEPLSINDWRGSLWNYLKKDRLVGINWLVKYIDGKCENELFLKLNSIKNSDLLTLRAKSNGHDEIDVYNIEVEANSEIDHNYVVFSKNNYTPILVGNCHASIVSRELGVPCIVGTGNATQVLKDGQDIIVDANKGKVYDASAEVLEPAGTDYKLMEEVKDFGELQTIAQKTENESQKAEREMTATSIKANIAFPEAAEKAAPIADGVGLLRAEHMLIQSGRHPAALARQDPEELVRAIEEGIGAIAKSFYPKPVWYRTLDARTDEFRQMEGGEDEPAEANPMLGWHGIRRALDEPDVFRCELQALKNLREKGIDNVSIMLPFIISVEELRAAKAMINFPIKVGIMVETPAAAAEIDAFCGEGIAFASIGSNDLTQLVLGVDRGNARIAKLYTEFHPAVLKAINSVIKSCRKHKVEVSLCGESGSNPRMAEFLVEAGIDSISVEVDAIESIRSAVAKTERRLLLSRLRE